MTDAAGSAPHVFLLRKSGQLPPELNHESLSAFTLGKLRQNGIKVRLETTARKADADAAHRTSGEAIETGMIVGTVGAQLGLQHPVSTEHRSAPAVGKAGGGGDPPQAGRGRLMNQKDNHEHST